MSNRERKLEELGYALEDTPEPGAIYRSLSIDGRTAYCSGAVPMSAGIVISQGKVPSIVSLLEAQQAAALRAANCLRLVARELGSLDEIERVLRTTGYVNSDVDFTGQHLVVNGASQLLPHGNEHSLIKKSVVHSTTMCHLSGGEVGRPTRQQQRAASSRVSGNSIPAVVVIVHPSRGQYYETP